MPTDPTSILSSTKDALGLMDEDVSFDHTIILFINSKLADIHQLGIGPEDGLIITDKTAKWSDLIGDEKRYESVKAYMYLSVRMLFDPPTIGYVITAMKEQLDKMEYRINRAREDIVNPIPPKDQDLRDDIWADPVTIDGGDWDA